MQYMIRFQLVILCLTFLAATENLSAQNSLTSSIRIEFPIGDVTVSYVESSEGMVLVAKSKSVSVRASRLHFGDGEHSVTYAATANGIETPNGMLNAARFKIKDGTILKPNAKKLNSWGRKRGEVYILVPNLRFQAVENPKDDQDKS